MLKIMISNTANIERRAVRAVKRLMERAEMFPEWPNTDIAYVQQLCYSCGTSFWLTYNQSEQGVRDGKCETCFERDLAERVSGEY